MRLCGGGWWAEVGRNAISVGGRASLTGLDRKRSRRSSKLKATERGARSKYIRVVVMQ